MKFLITGSLRSDRGPRWILTCALIFLALFAAAHLLREAGSSGLSPAAFAANLHEPGAEFTLTTPPPGFLAMLEDLHIDLFLFGLLNLFLGAVLYQIRLPSGAKQAFLYTLSISALLFTFGRGLTFFTPLGAWPAYLSGLVFYSATFALIALILLRLYEKPKGSAP